MKITFSSFFFSYPLKQTVNRDAAFPMMGIMNFRNSDSVFKKVVHYSDTEWYNLVRAPGTR